jgi:hypothetical protein
VRSIEGCRWQWINSMERVEDEPVRLEVFYYAP